MKKDPNKAPRGFAANEIGRKRDFDRLGGQSAPGEKRQLALNQTLAPSAAIKGGRTAAHGHSRGK